jgi:hypothetical protein
MEIEVDAEPFLGRLDGLACWHGRRLKNDDWTKNITREDILVLCADFLIDEVMLRINKRLAEKKLGEME